MLLRIRHSAPTVVRLLLLAWLAVAVLTAPYTVRLSEATRSEQGAALPEESESARVAQDLRTWSKTPTSPLVVVWTFEGDREETVLRPERLERAREAVGVLARQGLLTGPPGPVTWSEDGVALHAVLPLRSAGEADPATVLSAVRRHAGAVPGAAVHLAGPAAVQADMTGVFADVDGRLLLVAWGAVLVILLLVYRSVVMPVLVWGSSLLALALACTCLYAAAGSGLVIMDGQVQGIVFVLIIGASTDYGLLLVARYREELQQGAAAPEALRGAWRASWLPITASALTVAGALLALMLSALPANRALGPAGTVAMACATLTSLTFLPAALAVCGRAAFWPTRAVQLPAAPPGRWQTLAGLLDRTPRRVWVLTLVGLMGSALFAPGLSTRGVPLEHALPRDAPSVSAQAVLAAHFPAGTGSPIVVLVDSKDAAELNERVARVPGVVAARLVTGADGAPLAVAGRAQILATTEDGSDSSAAQRTVAALRASIAAGPGSPQVGGQSAQAYDVHRAGEQERAVIMAVVLAIIAVILALLLRCLLLPVLLVATVGLSFVSALGLSALCFHLVTGAADTEPTIVLFAFVFLVALGVDYNIFLMHRVRGEAVAHGTRVGLSRAVNSTSGVITSAGVVLAATFAALIVMPLLYLAQIGFIVAVGVLLDTLVVRLLLVPALVSDLGPVAWWPGRIAADTEVAGTGRSTPALREELAELSGTR
ncbi:MMPL family transporter [Streptomyces sp. NPDC006879]|uniref:MMPL family transporter n=1 Tax=Streptomyces sp. NPDC006879 TaxID=3364767 RepID=UPI0036C1E37B